MAEGSGAGSLAAIVRLLNYIFIMAPIFLMRFMDFAGREVQSVSNEIHERTGEAGTAPHGGVWLSRVAGQAEQRGRCAAKEACDKLIMLMF